MPYVQFIHLPYLSPLAKLWSLLRTVTNELTGESVRVLFSATRCMLGKHWVCEKWCEVNQRTRRDTGHSFKGHFLKTHLLTPHYQVEGIDGGVSEDASEAREGTSECLIPKKEILNVGCVVFFFFFFL